jgi:hypothetical protein
VRHYSNCRRSGFAQPGRAFAATDRQMNALVCGLCRPTEDEIRIVKDGS